MPKNSQKIGEANFKTAVFQEYFGTKRFAYMQELDLRYKRPPSETYWDYIIGRRDLLVPQDIRERKGSFFTPQVWVQKSQEYLAKSFGENW